MDKYYVYRPMIDLIGKSEGTAPPKGRGYNETLAYGAYTGGNVTLVTMTLDEVDALQTRMLQHPKNKWNSSAVGWGQIVRTTMRSIRKTLNLTGRELFDPDMQDRMICYLLGVRGIDKWLAGRLNLTTLVDNLAQEWASLPTSKGVGYYDGQRHAVSVTQVQAALVEVRKRHLEGQPETAVVEVEKPVVPVAVEKEVRSKSGILSWLTGLFGGGVGGLSWLGGANRDNLLIIGGGTVLVVLAFLIGGEWIVRRVRAIRKAVAE